MIVLGLKCYSHDTGAAILSDDSGELVVHAISEARLNRRKHSFTYPLMSIDYCLKALGLNGLDEVDLICIDRHMETWPEAHSQFGFENARRRYQPRYDDNHRWNYLMEQSLRIDRDKVRWVNHVDAHAASAYFASPFDQAAILVTEGGTGLYTGQGTTLTPIDRIGYLGDTYLNGELQAERRDHFVNSSYFYDKISSHLGYDIFGAGQTMALAGYADQFPRRDLVEIDGNRFDDFIINHDLTVHGMDGIPTYDGDDGEDLVTESWVNLARQAQETLSEDILYLAWLAKVKTGANNLCLAGGAALNCIINRQIYDSGNFGELYIQPAASDEGIPLGCALHGYYAKGGDKQWHMDQAYLGVDYGGHGLQDAIASWDLASRPAAPADVAVLLADGKIVGRVAGGSEYGPRALGNRSILADPRPQDMKEKLNREIKHREGFRPFAPSCLEGQVPSYFNSPKRSPFMVIAGSVRENDIDTVPAVTHTDGSCRVQTVSPSQNPAYHALIEAFGEATGCPVLLNTSFNDREEPIVETYQDAVSCFMRTGLDALYMEDQLIEKGDHPTAVDGAQILEDTAERVQAGYNELIEIYCDAEKFVELANKLYTEQDQPPDNLGAD